LARSGDFRNSRNFRYPITATGSGLSETFGVSEVSEVSEGRRETLAAETLVAGWGCATKA
jgi:hypothetical protein